jgi:hypothetical protein
MKDSTFDRKEVNAHDVSDVEIEITKMKTGSTTQKMARKINGPLLVNINNKKGCNKRGSQSETLAREILNVYLHVLCHCGFKFPYPFLSFILFLREEEETR